MGLTAEKLALRNRADGGFSTQLADLKVLDSYFYKQWNGEYVRRNPKTIAQAILVYTEVITTTTEKQRRKPFNEYRALMDEM